MIILISFSKQVNSFQTTQPEAIACKQEMYEKYGFTQEAKNFINSHSGFEIQNTDCCSCGGGGWYPGEQMIRTGGCGLEGILHEHSHVWWHWYRLDHQLDAINLAKDVVRWADEGNEFARGYVYGICDDTCRNSVTQRCECGWKGMYCTDNGCANIHNIKSSDFDFTMSATNAKIIDWEIYAGICSYTMGYLDMLPDYLRKYFTPQFKGVSSKQFGCCDSCNILPCGNTVLDEGELCDTGKKDPTEGWFCEDCGFRCSGINGRYESCRNCINYVLQSYCSLFCGSSSECAYETAQQAGTSILRVGDECAPGKICNTQCRCVVEDQCSGEVYEFCELASVASDIEKVSWNTECTSSDKACCSNSACIHPTDGSCKPVVPKGICYSVSSSYTNDKEAFCNVNGKWKDLDYVGDDTATGGLSQQQKCESCSGNKWIKAGEAGVGEYPDTNTLGCCGDDASEVYNYFKVNTAFNNHRDACKSLASTTCSNGCSVSCASDTACCNSNTDCILNGKCYSTAIGTINSGTGISVNAYTVIIQSDSHGDHRAFCADGQWVDCDNAAAPCETWCGYGNNGWIAGGESSSFGEYSTGSETLCCGDDDREKYVNQYCSGYTGGPKCCKTDKNYIDADGNCVDECPSQCNLGIISASPPLDTKLGNWAIATVYAKNNGGMGCWGFVDCDFVTPNGLHEYPGDFCRFIYPGSTEIFNPNLIVDEVGTWNVASCSIYSSDDGSCELLHLEDEWSNLGTFEIYTITTPTTITSTSTTIIQSTTTTPTTTTTTTTPTTTTTSITTTTTIPSTTTTSTTTTTLTTTTTTSTTTTTIPCSYDCWSTCTDDTTGPDCFDRISHGTTGCTGGNICCESIRACCGTNTCCGNQYDLLCGSTCDDCTAISTTCDYGTCTSTQKPSWSCTGTFPLTSCTYTCSYDVSCVSTTTSTSTTTPTTTSTSTTTTIPTTTTTTTTTTSTTTIQTTTTTPTTTSTSTTTIQTTTTTPTTTSTIIIIPTTIPDTSDKCLAACWSNYGVDNVTGKSCRSCNTLGTNFNSNCCLPSEIDIGPGIESNRYCSGTWYDSNGPNHCCCRLVSGGTISSSTTTTQAHQTTTTTIIETTTTLTPCSAIPGCNTNLQSAENWCESRDEFCDDVYSYKIQGCTCYYCQRCGILTKPCSSGCDQIITGRVYSIFNSVLNKLGSFLRVLKFK